MPPTSHTYALKRNINKTKESSIICFLLIYIFHLEFGIRRDMERDCNTRYHNGCHKHLAPMCLKEIWIKTIELSFICILIISVFHLEFRSNTERDYNTRYHKGYPKCLALICWKETWRKTKESSLVCLLIKSFFIPLPCIGK